MQLLSSLAPSSVWLTAAAGRGLPTARGISRNQKPQRSPSEASMMTRAGESVPCEGCGGELRLAGRWQFHAIAPAALQRVHPCSPSVR